jgi:hypothetical protein
MSTILMVGITLVLFLLLVLPLFIAFLPAYSVEMRQWLRYVEKAAPLMLPLIPNFPVALVPVVVQAISAAELVWGSGEGAEKKAAVMDTIREEIAKLDEKPDLIAISATLDNLIKMVNHASEIHANLADGKNADGSEVV